eukprot:TRINITY_DN29040_c0_g1_i1.p1 TRINITY_DN29040_c0_g1~~TRINITY_DN29040_c0_g1_i1.p1  ORF type:complete len:260 (+),score=66.99 TRINITY_DN29040_c0_g1_i1:244-1023(+)
MAAAESFAVSRKMADDGVSELDAASVEVDLQVSSTEALEAAIKKIRNQIEERSQTDVAKLAALVDHVEKQLDDDHPISFSLEHLELYHSWLDRVVVESGTRHDDVGDIDNFDVGPDLHDRVKELKVKVEKMLWEHPLAGVPRSGDRVGKPSSGSQYFKVPVKRRRQMLAMLYCNLFTGPSMVLITAALLWWFLPFGNYILLAYVSYVTYDNMTRKMPDGRVSQSWRNNKFYHLFRDCLLYTSDAADEEDSGDLGESRSI